MAVFSGTLKEVTCPVCTCTVAYTDQVTFYQLPEILGHVFLVGPVVMFEKYEIKYFLPTRHIFFLLAGLN